MSTHPVAVQPHLSIHVDAVKLNQKAFSLLFIRHREAFAIPGRAAGCEPAAHLTDRIGLKRRMSAGKIFNTPVVREVQRSPLRVIEIGLLRALSTAAMKTPGRIKQERRVLISLSLRGEWQQSVTFTQPSLDLR